MLGHVRVRRLPRAESPKDKSTKKKHQNAFAAIGAKALNAPTHLALNRARAA